VANEKTAAAVIMATKSKIDFFAGGLKSYLCEVAELQNIV
jgi:hypothetical protein